MVKNRRLLIAIVLVIFIGIVVRFALTNPRPHYEVYYPGAPDDLPSYQALEIYVCPECEAAIREAWAERYEDDAPKQVHEKGLQLYYRMPEEDGCCKYHPDTPLQATKDVPVDPKVVTGLPEDTEFVNRFYIQKDPPPGKPPRLISLTIIISTLDRRSIHRPESCMAAQGWRQVSVPTVSRLTGEGLPGGSLDVRQIPMERTIEVSPGKRANARTVVLNWYAAPPNRLTARETRRFTMMFIDRLIKGINYRWSSVLVQANMGLDTDTSAAAADAKVFAREFSVWAEKRRRSSEGAEPKETDVHDMHVSAVQR